MTDNDEPMVTLRMPRADWRQLVSDMEDMCGCSEEDIEILQSVKVLEGDL